MNHLVIKAEYRASKLKGVPFHTLDDEFMHDDSYTCIMLHDSDGWTQDAINYFPKTMRLLFDVYPHVKQAFLSVMNGPKFMAPHRNEETSNDVPHTLRHHTGIVVNPLLECIH